MQIDIAVKVDGKEHKGLMGVSLDEIQKPIVIVKKKKKKKKTLLQKAVESSIPVQSKYTTEEV